METQQKSHTSFNSVELFCGYGSITDEFKELGRFGRGAKSNFKLDNISKGQKQKVPRRLAKDIAKYVRGFFQNKPRGSFL